MAGLLKVEWWVTASIDLVPAASIQLGVLFGPVLAQPSFRIGTLIMNPPLHT